MFNLAPLITALLLGFSISACEQASAPSKQRKSSAVIVESLIVKHSSLHIQRHFNAEIIAPNTISITSQNSGTLLKMPHRVGSRVKRGQLLAQLDDSLSKAELLKASATLEKAEKNLQRINKLYPQQLASEEELSTAVTELKLAKAESTLKSIQVYRTVIKAPFDGVISERFYEPGDTVNLNSKLMTLVDNQWLFVRSAIPESMINKIAIGKKVKLSIPSLEILLTGTISTIYPTIDSLTQQVTIEASINSNSTQLFPGQFAELSLSYPTEKQIMIPVNAVQYDTNGSWVYLIDEAHKAKRQVIKTGSNTNEMIEVISGLSDDDEIITKGFVSLRPGKKIIFSRSNQQTQ